MVIFLIIFAIGFKYCGTYFKTSLNLVISNTVIKLDEDLPPFNEAAKLSECDWLVKENIHYRDTYGLELITETQSQMFENVAGANYPIQGIHWYYILDNPYYQDLFAYIPASVGKIRTQLIVDHDNDEGNDCEQSDVVALILNLGFIPQKSAKIIQFGEGMTASVVKLRE